MAERFWWILSKLSLLPYLLKTRVEINKIDDPQLYLEATIKRMRRVDLYVIVWCAVEFMLVCIAPHVHNWIRWFIATVAGLRLLEMWQAVVNLTLFDGLRLRRRRHQVASVERVVILQVLNFVELGVCFGLLYSVLPGTLLHAATWQDNYYFSFVTQTTLGYGDITPQGMGKIMAPLQALSGVLFGIIILARVMSLLPPISEAEMPRR